MASSLLSCTSLVLWSHLSEQPLFKVYQHMQLTYFYMIRGHSCHSLSMHCFSFLEVLNLLQLLISWTNLLQIKTVMSLFPNSFYLCVLKCKILYSDDPFKEPPPEVSLLHRLWTEFTFMVISAVLTCHKMVQSL